MACLRDDQLTESWSGLPSGAARAVKERHSQRSAVRRMLR